MSRKPDTIGYKEFNKLVIDENEAPKKNIRDEILFDDENTDQYKETLIGMEYSAEDLDELQDEDELNDAYEMSEEELEEDEKNDINADSADEEDESINFHTRQP